MTLVLYAIVDGTRRGVRSARERNLRPPLGKGLAGRPLARIRIGGASVVVERAPAPEPSSAKLRAYDRIVRRLAAAHPALLPFRFGSTTADASALEALLGPSEDAMTRALDRVRDCVQFTHRIPLAAAPKKKPRASNALGPGARYMAERFQELAVPEAVPLRNATAKLVRLERVERRADLASVYHLVPREKTMAYAKAVASLPPAVRIETTGPWPPYAFTELT